MERESQARPDQAGQREHQALLDRWVRLAQPAPQAKEAHQVPPDQPGQPARPDLPDLPPPSLALRVLLGRLDQPVLEHLAQLGLRVQLDQSGQLGLLERLELVERLEELALRERWARQALQDLLDRLVQRERLEQPQP